MKIRIMYGCVIEHEYDASEVKSIFAIHGEDCDLYGTKFVMMTPVKIYKKTLLLIVKTADELHVYDGECVAEFK